MFSNYVKLTANLNVGLLINKFFISMYKYNLTT